MYNGTYVYCTVIIGFEYIRSIITPNLEKPIDISKLVDQIIHNIIMVNVNNSTISSVVYVEM